MDSNNPLIKKHPASFRDPSGFLFSLDGKLYRQINRGYQAEYDQLMKSGLYQTLVKEGLLIPHQEVNDVPSLDSSTVYRVIRPEMVPFISYPYEWSFSQLKTAALVTLQIQRKALDSGMSLKDASAYNIQFWDSKAVLIDTLSFEIYKEGQPWVAYRQFCQHFMAPLALMAYRDIRLNQLLRVYIDGVPLDLASELLPFQSRLRFSLLAHIHLHAAAQKRYAGKPVPTKLAAQRQNKGGGMSRMALTGLLDSLESGIRSLSWQPAGTEWAEYYDLTNYSTQAFEEKKRLVAQFLNTTLQENSKPEVWDLGANTGLFSRIASQQGALTLSFDIDPAAVERNYQQTVEKSEKNILPLVLDLTNPSPALGWANQERQSLEERGPADVVMALALVHHLVISNNTPLTDLAAYLAKLGHWLIIEFVPKSDSQVQRLLASRTDIFTDYHRDGFGTAFSQFFSIVETCTVQDSERTLYLMKSRILHDAV